MKLLSTKKNIRKVFLCKNSTYDIDSKVDIIISPEFYWCRIFNIPAKNEKVALQTLPLLFEEFVNTNEKLNYYAKKIDENKFVCFAYNNNEIIEYFKKLNINTSNINEIYFAQLELEEFNSFNYENSYFMYVDEILVKTPFILSSSINLNNQLESINIKSKSLDIKFYKSSNINSKYLYAVIAFALIFTFMNIYKYFDFQKQSSNVQKKIENLKEKASMPSSIIRTKLILSKAKEDFQKQKKLREFFNFLSTIKNKGLKSIKYEKGEFLCTFEKQELSSIKILFYKYKNASYSKSLNNINVKVKL